MFCWLHVHLIVCLTVSIKNILYLKCTLTWMLYCASTIHLFVYIPTYVTWFSDANIDTLTPFFSLLSEYSSTAVGWFINSPMPMHVFYDYILLFLFVFFVSPSFFKFQLLHASWLCSNFNFSRLFFLPDLYFMHTKVVQRSIQNIAILLWFHFKMSLAAQYKIFNTVRVHVHLWQVIP